MVSRMKIERVKSELSQSRLADKARVYQVRISRIERGATPFRDEAEAIAKALGTRVEELFGELPE